MCFLGSEKYPGENEYKSYLAQHGGQSNASTSMHLTTYKFEILADFADHALDLFSNFFTAPLFTISGTGREVNAVDSENSKNLTADSRRRLQILKDLGDPDHYYTKFSTGNAQTLPTDTSENLERVRDALLSFHRKHYRPENLTVVVAGPQTLDQLQDWAVPRFAGMQARAFPAGDEMTTAELLVEAAAQDAPPYSFTAPEQAFQPAFRPDFQGSWPALLTVKPVRSRRKLVLMFPLPPVFKVPDQSPSSVLSHLLGHEGPNSPFAVLQNEGLLSSLSAGPRVASPDFTLFQVEIDLTDAGEKRWKDVVDVIFQHCRLLAAAKEGDLQRIWGEKATLNAMFFDQTSPGDVYSLAPSLCNSIVVYGTENSIAAGSMLNETKETFPSQQTSYFASRLVPKNCFIERCSEAAWEEMEQLVEVDASIGVEKKKERWYGIDYFLSEIDKMDVKRWEGKKGSTPFFEPEQLALPRENSYIPRTLELCADLPEEAKKGPRIEKEIDPPTLIVADAKTGRLWHRLDDRYALPKSSLTFLIRNAAVDNDNSGDVWQYSSNASVHSSLLSAMFTEAQAQETYDADLAGLQWNLSVSACGVRFAFSGFSDRLSDLSQNVLKEFLSNEFIKESHFLSAKDRLLRNLRTYFESRRADSHSLYYRDFLLSAVDAGLDDAIDYVESATLESVIAHHKTLLNNDEAFVECLFSGNVSENEARSIFTQASQEIIKYTGLSRKKDIWMPGSQERRLSPCSSVELHFASKNIEEENGSVVVTYQSHIPGFRGQDLSSKESLRSTAAICLLCHVLREPLFDELRTKQTLGYIVNSYYDSGVSSAPPNSKNNVPWTVPIDFIVVTILSRKLAPPEVLRRIDDFMASFRESLINMPESEIQDHASALSIKLLTPIQKIGTEVTTHFSKIQRFAPEVLRAGKELPWDNSRIMAETIRSLDRKAILEAWDRMMLPSTCARVVSCVYGTTFPLDREKILPSQSARTTVIVDSLSDIIELRKQLPVYDNSHPSSSLWSKRSLLRNPRALGLAAMVGAGLFAAGWTIMSRLKKSAK